MKNGIHPNYEKCTIRCACGEVVETRSTKGGEISCGTGGAVGAFGRIKYYCDYKGSMLI